MEDRFCHTQEDGDSYSEPGISSEKEEGLAFYDVYS
jgi:hypothetical protein